MKVLYILFIFLFACSYANDLVSPEVVLNGETDKLKFVLDVKKDCNFYTLNAVFENTIVYEKKSKTPVFIIDLEKIKPFQSISIYCDEQTKIYENKIIPVKYKTNLALQLDVENVIEIAKKEEKFFNNTDFLEEFYKVALSSLDIFEKSLKLIEFINLERGFAFVFNGYKRFDSKKAFEYLKNNYERFNSLPDYEDFIKLVFEKKEKVDKISLIDEVFRWYTKRLFNLIIPYIENDNELSTRFFEDLRKNSSIYFESTLLEKFEKDLKNKKYSIFGDTFFDLVLKNPERVGFLEFVRVTIFDERYSKRVVEALKKREIDKDMASFLRYNIEKIDKNLLETVYDIIEPYFNNDLMFYKEIVKLEVDFEDKILDRIVSIDKVDDFFAGRIIKSCKKRPVPDYVFRYYMMADEKIKKLIYTEISKEPITEKWVMDIIFEHDRAFFEREILKILRDERNILWDYAVENLQRLDNRERHLDFLLNLYNSISKEKREKLLEKFVLFGERGKDFVIDELKKGKIKNFEVISTFLEKADDSNAIKMWRLINKSDKDILLQALKGLENRKKPLVCDDIFDLTVNSQDREIKFSSMWAYVYSCGELFIKNFDYIVRSGDLEFYKESLSGFIDLLNLHPELKLEVKTKLEEIIKGNDNSEIKKIAESILKEKY